MKRLMLLMLAWMLALGTAALAETVPDIPLSAADSPVKLEELVPMDASKIVLPEVKYLPEDMPWIVWREKDDAYEYFILSARPDILLEVELYRSPADRYQLTSYSGALVPMTDGRWALRYAAHEDEVARLTLIYAYSDQDYDEKIIIDYFGGYAGGELRLFETELWVTTPERELIYIYNDAGKLQTAVSRPVSSGLQGQQVSYQVNYTAEGPISYAEVSTNNGSRTYEFYGASLWKIWDRPSGITIDYDWDSGVISSYEMDFTAPGTSDTAAISFSPYGRIRHADYYPTSAEEDIIRYVWSPVNGWYYIKKDYQLYSLVHGVATDLPDVSSITPPLPVLDMPDFRLDVSSVADLPACPIDVQALPRVLDFRAEDGLASVTLDSPLPLPEGAILRLCEEYALSEWGLDAEVYPATLSADGMSLTAAVPAGSESDGLLLDISGELCLDIYYPAADAGHFSFRYLYHPESGCREVSLDSPAAYFRYSLASDRSITEALCYDRLTDLIAYGVLTFDPTTGDLTEYVWYVEPTFDKTGWYRVFYVPGEGIAKAWIGEGEGVFYEWTPETGWLNRYGEPTDKDLLDPLHFPYAYPFPTDP